MVRGQSCALYIFALMDVPSLRLYWRGTAALSPSLVARRTLDSESYTFLLALKITSVSHCALPSILCLSSGLACRLV